MGAAAMSGNHVHMSKKHGKRPHWCRLCGKGRVHNEGDLCPKCHPATRRLDFKYAPHDYRIWALRIAHNRCSYCRTAIDIDTCNVDHIKPRKLGGKTCKSNLCAVCRECNKTKGNQYEGWFSYLFKHLEPLVPRRAAKWQREKNVHRAAVDLITWLQWQDHFPTLADGKRLLLLDLPQGHITESNIPAESGCSGSRAEREKGSKLLEMQRIARP